ncbi:FAR1-related sequence 5-like protein [Tanacetum coccineum]
MKCNYVAFDDVVSFDATFHTNKYGYKFVPFTGIDNHQKCVTFGVALLSDETTESFCWMLEAFLKTHKKQPPFAVLGDLAADTNFRKDFHKLNVLPAHLLDKRHRYGPCIEETNTLASQIHQTIEDCISIFRNDNDKLTELLSIVKELKEKLEAETQTPNVEPNKEDLYADLLGVTVPDKVDNKNEIEDEDEGDNKDEVDDEDEVDNQDEVDYEDEDYESKEE